MGKSSIEKANELEKQKAHELYDQMVADKVEEIIADEVTDLDPDDYSGRTEIIDGLDIYLKQDGLCSLQRIQEFVNDKEQVISDYRLIREGMFDVLIWPGYAISINQLRSSTFKDRIDLLLIDIFNFYEVTKDENAITKELINKLWNHCRLARAYLYPNTFYWLKSFGDFDGFVRGRKLQSFVTKRDGKPQNWIKDGDVGFTLEYYEELIRRTKKYRKKRKIELKD